MFVVRGSARTHRLGLDEVLARVAVVEARRVVDWKITLIVISSNVRTLTPVVSVMLFDGVEEALPFLKASCTSWPSAQQQDAKAFDRASWFV